MEKLWYYEKNMVLWEKTMVQWKNLLYYTENYGTLIYYGKTMVLCKILWNYSKL